jgi:hypothetical protein
MKRLSLHSVVSYLMILSIFVTGAGIELGYFKFYWYYPFYGLFLLYSVATQRRMGIMPIFGFMLLVLYALITYQTSLSLVIKQLINLLFSFFVFYFYFLHEKRDVIAIFGRYVRVAKVLAVLGLVQVLFFAVGIGKVYTAVFPWLKEYPTGIRLQSLTQEPSYIAFTFAPIAFIAAHNLFYRSTYFFGRGWSFVFIICYLLTQSTIAYASILIILVLVYMKNFSYVKLSLIFLLIALVTGLGVVAYRTVPDVKLRVDDTVTGLSGNFFDGDTFLQVNPSTYAILSNYYVTLKSFADYPIIGSGLGTYTFMYDRHIPDKAIVVKRAYMLLNRQDGASMAFRILVELGIVGIVAFLVFVWRYRLKSRSLFSFSEQMLWAINAGIFVLILLALLRNGNYTVHGKMLFLILYYYSYKIVKSGSADPAPTVQI